MGDRIDRHHYIPRSYLRRFADANDHVWRHHRAGTPSLSISTKDAGIEKHLYAPKVGAQPNDDELERELAKEFDDVAAPLITRLANEGKLSDADRLKLAEFIGVQERRIPLAKESMIAFQNQWGRIVLQAIASNPKMVERELRRQGKDASPDAVDDFRRSVFRGEQYVVPTKVPWLNNIANGRDLAPLIAELDWTVVAARGSVEFVTSDAPIVKVLPNPDGPILPAGWATETAEFYYSLSPEKLLFMAEGIGNGMRSNAPLSVLQTINKRIIARSDQHVFSRRPEKWVHPYYTKLKLWREKELQNRRDLDEIRQHES